VDAHGQKVQAPIRVMPGRLSVSRAFGDCTAKMVKYGGNPDCVIATPEIEVVPLSNKDDFILLGSDGVFDKLTNNQINLTVQKETLKLTRKLDHNTKPSSFEHMSACCGAAASGVLLQAME